MSTDDNTRILVVDDSPTSMALIENQLTASGYEVVTAGNGAEALRLVGEHGIQLVLTDWTMPEMNGVEFCRAVRSSPSLGFVYVIVMNGQADKERLVEAFDAGADDFLAKPFARQELLARLHAGRRIIDLEANLAARNLALHKGIAEMAILNRKLERMATTDELTALENRRQGLAKFRQRWEEAERYGHSLSCIMVDIDNFKKFNDLHGHAAGDVVLKQTAAAMVGAVRTADTCCRLGGEEFLVLCPNIDETGAALCAERIRSSVESQSVAYEDRELAVTVSLGVAQRDDGMACPDELLDVADRALYAAKSAGRNRVEVAAPTGVEV